MHPFYTRSFLAHLGLLSLPAVLCLASCSGKSSGDGADSPNAIAGNGGSSGSQPIAQAGSTPTAGSAQGGNAAGSTQGGGSAVLPTCVNVPQGKVAELDDFEDIDSLASPEMDRQGFWGLIHDETAGVVTPSADFSPEPGGADGSAYAAHVTASGYSNWGAAFQVLVDYYSDGEHCPYNASAFKGVRFYAKGSGKTRVTLVTPEVQSTDFGGTCDASKGMTCFDGHGTYLSLAGEWTLVKLPWTSFAQKGWGTAAAFRPDAIMALQFSFETGNLPVDLWIDQVSFWNGVVTPPNEGGEAGAGGAGN